MRTELNKASKIVIKLGSSIIDNRDDMIINGICTSITEFLRENKEVMLVTSGAVGVPLTLFGLCLHGSTP